MLNRADDVGAQLRECTKSFKIRINSIDEILDDGIKAVLMLYHSYFFASSTPWITASYLALGFTNVINASEISILRFLTIIRILKLLNFST